MSFAQLMGLLSMYCHISRSSASLLIIWSWNDFCHIEKPICFVEIDFNAFMICETDFVGNAALGVPYVIFAECNFG